ncbi:molybdopterin-dependent oxidoreductase [Sphingobacterium sp. lm-10]|uniref:molybdopterin-dependent oxidoreductase n=1 Tax=Sphingobacterium sp. lm-10 TaxID=2944904 RepID=UPI00201FCEAB|nr:molybdopterin-dependent oxidoreductase [Sphingobacterium sp. lm-10]MCL7989067.1 molybdopterin-dependent oxidoreductase [Sphingobacterium sp. lm-10]
MRVIYLMLLLSACFGSMAQDRSFELKISGDIPKELVFDQEDFEKLPTINEVLKDNRSGKAYVYTGVNVQALLEKAGAPVGAALRGENLSKFLLVRCADGYEVLFSLAELDSSFTDRRVVLAYLKDDVPLDASEGPLRLIVPGEKKPARSCFQVVEIIIGFAPVFSTVNLEK